MQDESRHSRSTDEQTTHDNLFLRGDTILGACEGIGQDFGFNPNWLRVVFAGAFYWNPPAVIGAYVALAALVAISRLLFPVPRAAAVDPVAPAGTLAAAVSANSEHQGALPLAA